GAPEQPKSGTGQRRQTDERGGRMTLLDPEVIPDTSDPEPLLSDDHTMAGVTDKISDVVLKRPITLGWIIGFFFTFSLVMLLTTAIGFLIVRGIGIWGVN